MNNLTRSQFQSHPYISMMLLASGFSTPAVAATSPGSIVALKDILQVHFNNPELLTSLVLTKHAIPALDTLALMLDSLPADSVLVDLILQKFAESIKVLANIVDGKLVTTHEYLLQSSHVVNSQIKELWQCGGVYVFTQLDTGLQYVGSAINFSRDD